MGELDIRAFALACGVLWSSAMFVLGILSMTLNWDVFSSVYIGYKPSIKGILIGAVWGFADGIIGGICIAWLYNKFI